MSGDLEKRPRSLRRLVPYAVLGVPIVVSAAIAAVLLIVDGYIRDTAVVLVFLVSGALLAGPAVKLLMAKLGVPQSRH